MHSRPSRKDPKPAPLSADTPALPRLRLGALLLALVVAVLLPALTVGGYATWQAVHTAQAAAEARLSDTAAALALAVDREIGGQAAALTGFATSPAFGPDPERPDVAALDAHARRIAATLGTHLSVLRRDGARIVATGVPPGAAAQPSNVPEVIERVFATGQPEVTDLGSSGAITRAPVVSLALPVQGAQGRAALVVMAAFRVERLRDLLATHGPTEGAFASIVDTRDIIVARSDALHDRFVGQRAAEQVRAGYAGRASGIFRARTLDGVERVVAFRALSAAPGWRVFVGEPRTTFDAAWHGPVVALGAGGAVTLLLGAGLALLAARGILRPVARLGAHAEALAAGNGTTPAGAIPPAPVRELEVLRRGFAGAEAAAAEREAERAASERRFRTVFENAAIGMARVAFEGERWMDVNDAFCRMLGRDRAEMLGTPWPAMTHPDDVELDLVPFRRMAQGELESYAVEKRFLHADGHHVWARLTLSLVRDEAGRPDYEIAVIEDITARRETEAALAAGGRRLRAVLESTADGVISLDAAWSVTFINGNAARMVAGGRDILGQEIWHAFPDAVGGAFWQAYQRCMAERVATEAEEHYRPLGRTFAARAFPAEDGGITVFFQDVTEARAAVRRIAESEARYRTLFDNMAEEVRYWQLVRDAAGRIQTWRLVDANPPALRSWGKALEEIRGRTADEIFGPGATAHDLPVVERIMRERVPAFHEDYVPSLDRHVRFASVPLEEHFITTGADITAQKRVEARLRESEERLRRAELAAGTGTFDWDIGRGVTTLSEGYVALHGLPPGTSEETYEGWLARVHPADREATVAQTGSLSADAPLSLEYRIVRPRDGATRWIAERREILRDGEGRALRVIGLQQDVTERREAEARLRESEARLRLALDAGRMGVFAWDLATDRLEWDARQHELFGTDPAAGGMTAARALALVHPEDRAALQAAIDDVVSAGEGIFEYEFRLPLAVGRVRWIAGYGRVVPGPDGRAARMVGLNFDTTAAREAEAALARSNEEARIAAERVQLALAAGAILGTWDWDLPTDRFTVDERFAESFGLDPALGRTGLPLETIIATVHPEDVAGLRVAIAAAIARGGSYSHDYRVRSRDGVYRWIQANGRVDHAPDGTPTRFPGVLLDIEARRALEAERDRAAGLLRAFADAVPGVVYAKDRDGRLLVGNRGVAALIGKPPEFYLGRTDAEFLDDPVQAAAVMATDRRIMDSGTAEQIEEAVNLPDGTPAVWLSTKAPFRDAEGRVIGLIGASVDITARKAAETVLARSHEELERLVEARTAELRATEARLAEAARLEALGRLAGGIAHDFNNVLQAVQGGVTLASRRLDRDPGAARGFLALALDAIERGVAVTGRLLAFARRGELSAGALEPGALLDGLAQILRHTLGDGVMLVVDVAEGTPALLGDAAQLEAVLVNLANNARDALPGGTGTVTLRARPATGAGTGAPPGLAPGDYVLLSVGDDGEGMPPQVLARVTEPFFTTKPRGKGTGLGLAMARGFAEQSGGALAIESAPGRGTTVTLWMPRAPATAVPVSYWAERAPGQEARDVRTAAVLLVDDEPDVRATVAAGLADRGHRVLQAEDARTALIRLDAGAEVEVLVTDLSMPGGMDGLALLREARRRRPGLPALLITGHTGEAARQALEEAVGSGPFAVIRKPASAEAVGAQIVALLHVRHDSPAPSTS